VEGAPLTAGGDDAGNNRVEVFQDFNGWNAEGRKSNAGKSLIAKGVAGWAIATFMRFAIDFDRKARFETGEV
jgi:hypothetical protein